MASASLINEFGASPDDSRRFDGTSEPVKSSESPLPDVKEFDSSSATVNDVVNALKIAGGVIMRNFLSVEEINRILKDVNPYLEADKPWDGKQSNSATSYRSLISDVYFTGDFFPPETRRAFGLMGKSHTFATSMVGNPFWMGVADALLTSHNKHNWVSCLFVLRRYH
jgi:hypothetical protein